MNFAHRSSGENRTAVYEAQLVEADKVSLSTNPLAFFFTFIILWGFVTLPGTYAELQTAEIQNNSERRIVKIILQIPLLAAATTCCTLGLLGMFLLLFLNCRNLFWVFDHLYVPGFFNGLTGLATTLAGVYGARSGLWTTTEQVAALVTGIAMLVFGLLMIKRYYVEENKGRCKIKSSPHLPTFYPSSATIPLVMY